MKTILLNLLLAGTFILSGNCQGILNGDFELWENDNKKPIGWTTGYNSPGLRQTTDCENTSVTKQIYTLCEQAQRRMIFVIM